MIVPNKSMSSQFTQTPYIGSSYNASSTANTDRTHLWASPNAKKLKSFRFTLDSSAPQIVNARAKRFNTITDESDTDNFVVFNQNKKGKRKFIDDTVLYLDHGSSTFVFNTEFADINIKDSFTTTSVPQVETNATVFLGEETRASIEWWDDMTKSTDRKQIEIYGFNEDDFIETRYLDSFQNTLDFKLEQDGDDVVIKYRNNLSANANDDSLYSVLRIKSIELDQIEDQISELPDGYNLEPEDEVQNNESEIADPEMQDLDYDAILLTLPDVFVEINSFDPSNGKIIVFKSQFGLPTNNDPMIKFAKSNKKALALAGTDADFVYAEKKGILYFNENESLQGWGAGGEVLELTEKPKLTSDNFQFFDI